MNATARQAPDSEVTATVWAHRSSAALVLSGTPTAYETYVMAVAHRVAAELLIDADAAQVELPKVERFKITVNAARGVSGQFVAAVLRRAAERAGVRCTEGR